MTDHVVRFGAGRARRFLARAAGSADPASGHRPFVWTAAFERALTFACPREAHAFARDALGHGRFAVGLAQRAAA